MARITLKERLHIPKYDDRESVCMGRVAFDQDKCTGCGQCARICPASAIIMVDKKPQMVLDLENECMACADCMAICPEGAVDLEALQKFSGFFKTIDRGAILPPRL
jgi:ferredoxin